MSTGKFLTYTYFRQGSPYDSITSHEFDCMHNFNLTRRGCLPRRHTNQVVIQRLLRWNAFQTGKNSSAFFRTGPKWKGHWWSQSHLSCCWFIYTNMPVMPLVFTTTVTVSSLTLKMIVQWLQSTPSPCVSQCRRCPQQSTPIMFLVFIALICGGFIAVLAHVVEGKWTTSYHSNQIISGIFASGILAFLVYTVKSVYTQYMPNKWPTN